MNCQQYKEFIETSIENIRKAHNESYLSIFAGAGISTESKLPKWGDLIHELQKRLYGDTKENEDYLVFAEKFYNQFGESFYYQTLKSLIPDNAKPNDLHLGIVKLNIKNLITNNKKLEKYYEERISIDLNESFYELPFQEREQIKYFRDINITLNTNLIEAYQLKEKALRDLEIWSSSDSSFSFNSNQTKADGIFKKTLSEYFSFLIINGNQEKFFEQMIEIFFSFLAIYQIQEKRRNNNETIPITLKSERIYCILKYFDNKTLMQKLNQYFQKTNIIFKTERDIDLIGIFKNISSQFVNIDIFETEFSRLFKNFLVLSAWIELDQNAFDAIVEIYQEKIDKDILRNSYDSIGYFITKQWNKFKMEIKTEIKFSILDRILFSFIRKLTENFEGNLIFLQGSCWMQNLLFILQQCNIEYHTELDLIQQALINTLIKKIMELPNDAQIFISNFLICDLFPITKNNDGVNQNVKKFLINIWEKNQNRKTIQEDEAYLLLTYNMHRICILNSEQYQKIFFELKNKYMNRETTKKFNNEQPIQDQLLKQAMQENTPDRILDLLKNCENSFKKE
ncbi:hypothetical protein HpRN126_01380 [Helicobacter pylori]